MDKEIELRQSAEELADWSTLVQKIALNPVAASLDSRVDELADRLIVIAQAPVFERHLSVLRADIEELGRRYTGLLQQRSTGRSGESLGEAGRRRGPE